jgi:hypothetical protein
MAAFFTADTHFGDVLILRRRGRLALAAEHDGALITRWNETVGPEDEVWYLGDFAAGASWARCAEIFAGLNGIKRLIRGNHDTNRVLNLPWADPPLERARVTVRDRCPALPCALRAPVLAGPVAWGALPLWPHPRDAARHPPLLRRRRGRVGLPARRSCRHDRVPGRGGGMAGRARASGQQRVERLIKCLMLVTDETPMSPTSMCEKPWNGGFRIFTIRQDMSGQTGSPKGTDGPSWSDPT